MGPGHALREMGRKSCWPSTAQGSSGEPADWRHGRQTRGGAHFNYLAGTRGYHAKGTPHNARRRARKRQKDCQSAPSCASGPHAPHRRAGQGADIANGSNPSKRLRAHRGLTSHIGGPLRHQTRRRRQRCHRAHCHKPTKGNSDCSRGSASSPSSRNRRGVRRCPDLGH